MNGHELVTVLTTIAILTGALVVVLTTMLAIHLRRSTSRAQD